MQEQITTSWDKLTEKLVGWVDSFIYNLPNLLIALLVFIIAYWISRYLQRWTRRVTERFIKQPSVRGLVANVTAVFVVVIGLFLALAILNLDGTLKSLLAGAGIAGLAISLALQGTLANTFSGLFIAIKDDINVGDWIVTNGYAGKVVSIDLRNTKIVEADNNIVVLPNTKILDNPFKNFGLTERIRCTINCGVAYDSDLRQVKRIATETIEGLYPPGENETIEFYYTDFGASSIDFMLRFWVDAKEKLTAIEVKSEAIMTLKEAFDNHGIDIPFPIRTLIHENINNKELSIATNSVEHN